MKICIIGCGAVGSLFAAHLARAGEADVWAYDVWKEHIDAINKNGLTLSGAADFNAHLKATRKRQSVFIDGDRKSTRLNSSHGSISYAVFCLKKKKKDTTAKTAEKDR